MHELPTKEIVPPRCASGSINHAIEEQVKAPDPYVKVADRGDDHDQCLAVNLGESSPCTTICRPSSLNGSLQGERPRAIDHNRQSHSDVLPKFLTGTMAHTSAWKISENVLVT